MTQIIKEITLKEIKEIQEKGKSEYIRILSRTVPELG
jgi:hypothetical protein